MKHEKSKFCFLKNDYKSTYFNLRFGPCGLLMIFWTDATVTVHGSSKASPWETILLTVLLALAEIAELLEFAILVELLVFATLVELLAFAAIVTLLAFITEFRNVKPNFASLFRCAFSFFSSLSLWVDFVWRYQGRIFFLILFYNVFQSCCIASTRITHVIT